MGVLHSGWVHNAEGMNRHALPPHLPPALSSSPFTWVSGWGRERLGDWVSE